MKITKTHTHESINNSFLITIEEKELFSSRIEPFLCSEFTVFLHRLYCNKNETKIKQKNVQYLHNVENKIYAKLIFIPLHAEFTFKNY